MVRPIVVLAALLLPFTTSCRTGQGGSSSTKDIAAVESTGLLSAEQAIYYISGTEIFRAVCPGTVQAGNGNARAACLQIAAQASVSGFRTTITALYAQQFGAFGQAESQELEKLIQIMSNPGQTLTVTPGGLGERFMALMNAAVTAAPDGPQQGGGGGGGGLLPPPAGLGLLAGPVTTTAGELTINGLSRPTLSRIRVQLSDGCPFRTVGVTAGQGFLAAPQPLAASGAANGGSSMWQANPAVQPVRLFIAFNGGAGSCQVNVFDGVQSPGDQGGGGGGGGGFTNDPFSATPATLLDQNGNSQRVQQQAGVPQNVVVTPPQDTATADSYYVVFWSYQRGENISLAAKLQSHTFASFIHMTPGGAGPQAVITPFWTQVPQYNAATDAVGFVNDQSLGAQHGSFTVSWMPGSGRVGGAGSPKVHGMLTPVDFEIRRGAAQTGGVFIGPPRGFAWGPFRISEAVFQRAEAQRELLRSGRISYRSSVRDPARDQDYVGGGLALPDFFNCLAAVGDIAPGGGIELGMPSGANGTRKVVGHFRSRGAFVTNNPGFIERHAWVATQLNFGQYSGLFPAGLEIEDVSAAVTPGRQ